MRRVNDTPDPELRASKGLRSIVTANERLLTPDGNRAAPPPMASISDFLENFGLAQKNSLTESPGVDYLLRQKSSPRDFVKLRYCTISQTDMRHTARPCRRFLFALALPTPSLC